MAGLVKITPNASGRLAPENILTPEKLADRLVRIPRLMRNFPLQLCGFSARVLHGPEDPTYLRISGSGPEPRFIEVRRVSMRTEVWYRGMDCTVAE
jgi:hypothetical protein